MSAAATPEPVNRLIEISSGELEELRAQLTGLSFGSVLVIVHDGAIVQIERTEKRRLRGHQSGGKSGE